MLNRRRLLQLAAVALAPAQVTASVVCSDTNVAEPILEESLSGLPILHLNKIEHPSSYLSLPDENVLSRPRIGAFRYCGTIHG